MNSSLLDQKDDNRRLDRDTNSGSYHYLNNRPAEYSHNLTIVDFPKQQKVQ
jgi:hypothetical protein